MKLNLNPPSSKLPQSLWPLSLLSYLFIASMIFLAIYEVRPPATVAKDAPPNEFSSGRAMQHLQIIAQATHPIGSQAEANVRQYLLKELLNLGLDPQIQSATVLAKTPIRALGANVQNITGRLAGAAGSGKKAILLMAHYDSVPHSYGASDDGSGVVVVLETLRALKAGPPLQNDVMVLLSDGEEIGLMGAKAFVDENPLLKDVGLVLNFEARGSNGPVYMFETGEKNAWLIHEFARAAPHPTANSLMYSIYKLLPNDTDLTVLKKAGKNGFNFAYIDGINRYHTARDNLNTVDERSVQHGGSYALALVRHFGNLNLDQAETRNAVYFDILGSTLISYPETWAAPLTILVVLLFVAVIIWGLKKRELSPAGIILGCILFILSLLCSAIVTTLVWQAMLATHRGYTPFTNGKLYILSFAALTIAITSTLYFIFNKRIGLYNLSAGALLLWLVLAILSNIYLVGASYLFLWPLLFSSAALALMIGWREKLSHVTSFIILCICALPGLLLISSTFYSLFQGLSLGFIPLLISLLMLLLGLLIPFLKFINIRWRMFLPASALALSVIFLVMGSMTPAYSGDNPGSDSVLYCLNADTGEALWASPGERPDSWSSQFFSGATESKTLTDDFPNTDTKFLTGKAPVLNLTNDELSVLEDKTNEGTRRLHLKITSPRGARIMAVFVKPDVKVLSGEVNGKQLEYKGPAGRDAAGKWWELTYTAITPEGIDLILEIEPKQSLVIKVLSRSDGLPEIPQQPIRPRPGDLIPSPGSDTTNVTRTFNL
jgi:hypothetical protein